MGEWIKCSERFPINGQQVICSGFIFNEPEKGRWVSASIFEDDDFYSICQDDDGEDCANFDTTMHPPTHWQPLPEPPK